MQGQRGREGRGAQPAVLFVLFEMLRAGKTETYSVHKPQALAQSLAAVNPPAAPSCMPCAIPTSLSPSHAQTAVRGRAPHVSKRPQPRENHQTILLEASQGRKQRGHVAAEQVDCAAAALSPERRRKVSGCTYYPRLRPGPVRNNIAGILRRMQPRCQRYRGGSPAAPHPAGSPAATSRTAPSPSKCSRW